MPDAAALITEMLTRWGCGQTVNSGHCSQFADELARKLRGAETFGGEAKDGRQHVWLRAGGRHYDAESPQGVSDPTQLPFFQRHGGIKEMERLKSASGKLQRGTRVTLDSTLDSPFGVIPAGTSGFVTAQRFDVVEVHFQGQGQAVSVPLQQITVAKALGKNKALGGLLEYDEDADEADFVVSTEAPDRDGDTVAQESIDWSEFDVNPALTLSHDTETIPAGSWLPETRRTVKVKDPRSGETVMATVMRARFNMNTAGGKELAMSVRDGHMRGASISFLPSDEGTQKNRSGGSHYEGAKVTEIAVCNVPANQGATRAVEMVLKSLRTKAIPDHPRLQEFRVTADKWDASSPAERAAMLPAGLVLDTTKPFASLTNLERTQLLGKKSKAPQFSNFEPKLDGDKWGVWNRRGNKWESRERFPDRSSAWNYAERLYSELLDDEARWGETVSHSIKFWRHKTDKGRVRVMRKDVGAFANEMAIEPLDEEPKAEDLVEWAEEEMQEPEHEEKAGITRCPGCGYAVTTTGAITRCPECGYAVFSNPKAKATDDLADASAERAMQLSDVPAEEAVDAAMEEQDVPKAMRPAVKRLALKRLVSKGNPKGVLQDIYVPGGKTVWDVMSQAQKDEVFETTQTFAQLMALVDRWFPRISHNRPFPEDRKKALDDKDCSDMPGYKYLKGIIDELESKRKGIENEHVTRAADKALDALKAGIVRAYGKDAYPGDQEEVVENELEQVQVDDKWTNYDGTTDEYVGEYDTEEAAKRGVREETDAEVPLSKGQGDFYAFDPASRKVWNGRSWVDPVSARDDDISYPSKGDASRDMKANGFTGVQILSYAQITQLFSKSKSLKRWPAHRKNKGLSKATSALLKDQTEVLDDLAGGSDLPKRYKGTVAGVSSALKTLLTKDAPEETLLSKEADEEAVLALAKSIEAKADDFDVAMKRKYGQMWSRDKN